MSNHRFLIHGLCIESDILLAALPATRERDVDIRIKVRTDWERAVPSGAPVVACRPGAPGYVAWRANGEYLLRLPNTCDFAISAAGDRIDVCPASGADSGLVPLWTAGLALAFAVTIRGGLVLHASAFRVGQATFAVAGRSGAGKTTIAALATAAGCPLLADDALRVEASGNQWVAHAASNELRLRNGGDRFGALFSSGSSSVDNRWLVRPPHAGAGPFPVSRLLFPVMDERAVQMELVKLNAQEAAIELLRGQRFGAWTDPAILQRCTCAVAQLARGVRATRIALPRAHCLDRDMARQLVALLGEELESTSANGARNA